MMKLIFLHGRAQEGKDPQALKTEWVNAWVAGLAKNGLSLPAGLDIVFPFYGDLLDTLVKQTNLPENMENVIARGEAGTPDLNFFNDFLLELAANENISEAEIAAGFTGDVRERGPLNWGWVQTILQKLDGTKLSTLSLKKFTYDVYLYLSVPGIRRKIDAFVTQEMGIGPCVVLAHSLGTVVSFNILRNHPDWFVKQYLTVGSPLGLKSIQAKLDTPFAMPGCIAGGWFNAYDDRDVVALQPLDKDHFDITPAIRNYDGVRNHTSNRHGIEGYLDDAVVAKALYDALVL